VQIWKRISFSLDGVWAESWLLLNRPRRINTVFPGVVNFPWAQQWNALVSESASACQYSFDLFWTLVDVGRQNAGEGSVEILRTHVAAAVPAAKKHQFCQPSCARYRAKFADDTPGPLK
jgi:hypothetical protein